MFKTALNHFKNGQNCCQSIVSAYGAVFGLSEEQCLKIGASFGGGIGKTTRFLCGAINGAFIVLGFRYYDKIELNKKVRQLINELETKHKSLVCKDLLSENMHRTMHSKKCEEIINEVCTFLDLNI